MERLSVDEYLLGRKKQQFQSLESFEMFSLNKNIQSDKTQSSKSLFKSGKTIREESPNSIGG